MTDDPNRSAHTVGTDSSFQVPASSADSIPPSIVPIRNSVP